MLDRRVPSRIVWVSTVVLSAAFGLSLYVGRGSVFLALGLGALLVLTVARRPAIGMYAAVILMPLEAFGRVSPGVSAMTWAKLTLVLTVFAWLVSTMASRAGLLLPKRSWMLFGVFGVALVATALYGATAASVWGLVALLGQMAFVVLAVNLIRSDREFRTLLVAIVAGSVPVVIVGLLDIITGTSVLGTVANQAYASTHLEVFRITSTFYDPNALGRYLAFAFSITFGMAVMPRYRPWLPVAVLLLLAQGICLIYTFSRGALLALAVGLLVYAVWTRSIHTSVLRVVALFGALAAAVSLNVAAVAVLLERVTGGTAAITVDFSRLRIWAAALEAVAAHPFIGVGPDSVTVVLGSIVGAPVSPHNLYIEVLLGVGIVGFVLMAGFLVPALRSAASHVNGSLVPESRLVVVATVVVLATGLSLHGLKANELWVSLAMLASLEALDVDPAAGES